MEALFFIYVREREREREDERATEFAWYVAGRSGGGGGDSGRRALLLYVRTSRTPTCHHYKHSRGWLASRHALTYIFLSLCLYNTYLSLSRTRTHTYTHAHLYTIQPSEVSCPVCLPACSLSLPPSPLLSTTGPAERGVNTRARAGTARSVAGSSARKCVRERARNRIVDVVLVLLVVVVVVVAVAPLTCARVCGCV